MKALLFTLIIFGGAFLAYDYFVAPAGSKVVFKSLDIIPEKPVQFVPAPTSPADPAQAAAPQADSSGAKAQPATPPSAAAVAPPPPTAATPPPESNGFTPPRYDPIEVLTANWTKIPASAFPRPIHLKTDVQFKMGAGSAKVAAGAPAVALAFDNGTLTVAPTETSPARAAVALDATDLKSILNTAYEEWKPQRTDMLRKLYARKIANMKAQGASVAPTGSLDTEGKPVRAADGTYPVLLASMASGQVTEVTTKNVHSWGLPMPAKIDGKDGWSIKVNYDATTIFGPMPVEAQALVFNGRVKGWYYVGSGEEVP